MKYRVYLKTMTGEEVLAEFLQMCDALNFLDTSIAETATTILDMDLNDHKQKTGKAPSLEMVLEWKKKARVAAEKLFRIEEI